MAYSDDGGRMRSRSRMSSCTALTWGGVDVGAAASASSDTHDARRVGVRVEAPDTDVAGVVLARCAAAAAGDALLPDGSGVSGLLPSLAVGPAPASTGGVAVAAVAAVAVAAVAAAAVVVVGVL